jgi:hypothetical protein
MALLSHCDAVIANFQVLDPSGGTVVLVSTQRLTEISKPYKDIYWDVKAVGACG